MRDSVGCLHTDPLVVDGLIGDFFSSLYRKQEVSAVDREDLLLHCTAHVISAKESYIFPPFFFCFFCIVEARISAQNI